MSFEEIEKMSKATFKKIAKKRITEKFFAYLLNIRNERKEKGMEINYSRLKVQNYLRTEDIYISNDERKLIFQLRTKICFKIKSHFRSMHYNTIFSCPEQL